MLSAFYLYKKKGKVVFLYFRAALADALMPINILTREEEKKTIKKYKSELSSPHHSLSCFPNIFHVKVKQVVLEPF